MPKLKVKPEPLPGADEITGRKHTRTVYCCFVGPDGRCPNAINPHTARMARDVIDSSKVLRYCDLRLLCPEHVAQARDFWTASMP